MTGTVCYRAGGVADLESLMATMTDAFDPEYGEAWTHGQCAGILSMPGVWLTLACHGDVSIGFALARTIADEAELLLLAVAHAHRRCGIGAALLAHTGQAARTRGAARLFLEVRHGNPAQSLYHAAGFVEVGRRRGYYRSRDGGLHDAHTLELRLDAPQGPPRS